MLCSSLIVTRTSGPPWIVSMAQYTVSITSRKLRSIVIAAGSTIPPRPITIDQVPPLWLVLTLINRHNPDTSPLGLWLMLITSVLISRITTRPGPKWTCWAKSPAGVRYKLTLLRQVRIISLWLFCWHRQGHGSASSGCMLLPWFFFARSLTSIAMARTPRRSYAQAGCQILNVSPEHF